MSIIPAGSARIVLDLGALTPPTGRESCSSSKQ
jgi:hypothetical protein